MKVQLIISAIALVALSINSASSRAADENWSVDFEEAKAAAAKEGKSVLMEFTGSDWCPPCKALHKNVLSTDKFLTEAPKHFVLLKLDSPRDKSHQSEAEQAQYKELSKRYKVRGVPTIILADATGKPYVTKVGYGGQSADDYVADLVDKVDVLKQRDELLAKADKAEGVAKAKLLSEAISLIDEDLAVSTYRDTIDQIVALDEADEAGLKSKYETIIKSAELKTRLQSISRELRGRPAEAVAQLDALIEEAQPTGALLQEVLYNKFAMLYSIDKDAAKEALLKAWAIDKESNIGKNATRILEQVFKVDPEKLEAAKEDDDSSDEGDAS